MADSSPSKPPSEGQDLPGSTTSRTHSTTTTGSSGQAMTPDSFADAMVRALFAAGVFSKTPSDGGTSRAGRTPESQMVVVEENEESEGDDESVKPEPSVVQLSKDRRKRKQRNAMLKRSHSTVGQTQEASAALRATKSMSLPRAPLGPQQLPPPPSKVEAVDATVKLATAQLRVELEEELRRIRELVSTASSSVAELAGNMKTQSDMVVKTQRDAESNRAELLSQLESFMQQLTSSVREQVTTVAETTALRVASSAAPKPPTPIEATHNRELAPAPKPVEQPPAAEPVAKPPVAELPVAEPPAAEPPAAEPPVAELPVAEPPAAEPPVEAGSKPSDREETDAHRQRGGRRRSAAAEDGAKVAEEWMKAAGNGEDDDELKVIMSESSKRRLTRDRVASGDSQRLAPLAVQGMRPGMLGPHVPAVIRPFVEGDGIPWIAAEMPHGARQFFSPSDGFDVYIDKAAFCPDNLSISKVVFKAMNSAYEVVGEPMEKSCCLDCSLLEPEFLAYAAFRPETARVIPPSVNEPSPTAASTGRSRAPMSARSRGPPSARLESTVGAPPSAEWDWDPTLTLLFRVDGLDAHTQELHAAGYAVLNVFTTDDPDESADGEQLPRGWKQPDRHTPRSRWRINTGAFQIPLFMGPPDRRNHPMSGSVLELSEVDRVPCASLLVRIVKAPKATDVPQELVPPSVARSSCLSREMVSPAAWLQCLLDVPPPQYDDGVYDSARCRPRDAEVDLYPRRADLDVPSLREALAFFTAEVADGRSLKRLGDIPPAGADDDQLVEWIDKKLDDLPKSMLDYRYISPYVQSSGLLVSIDGVNNAPPDHLLRVACCMIGNSASGDAAATPPLLDPKAARRSSAQRSAGDPRWVAKDRELASRRGAGHCAVTELDVGTIRSALDRQGEGSWLDVEQQAVVRGGAEMGRQWFVSKATNWSAPSTLQAFQDPFVRFSDPYVPSTCLFMHVFAAEVFAGGRSIQMEKVGWALLPVFDKRSEGYTRRGAFSVPVFAGASAPAWVMDTIVADPTKTENLIQSMVSGTTGKKDAPHPLLVPPGEPVSILVRIQDGQFEGILPVSTSRYSASLAPKPVRSRFLLSSRMPFHLEQPRLSTIVPKTVTSEEAEGCLVQAVRAIVEGRAAKTGVFAIRSVGQAYRTAATAVSAVNALQARGLPPRHEEHPVAAGPPESGLAMDEIGRVPDQSRDPFHAFGAEATDNEMDNGVYGVRAYASSASDSLGEDSVASPAASERRNPGMDYGSDDFGDIVVVDPVAFHQASITSNRARPWADSIAIRVARAAARSGAAAVSPNGYPI
jgi:hypothetical protein